MGVKQRKGDRKNVDNGQKRAKFHEKNDNLLHAGSMYTKKDKLKDIQI